MILAIDIGGTKTLLALFSKSGHQKKHLKFTTPLKAHTFVNILLKNLNAFTLNSKIDKVVVAIPGIVQKNYSFIFGNRPWQNLDLKTPIKSLFDCPIFFENDANLAALYESKSYSGKTIFLTFSTGVGGGIIENGSITKKSQTFEPGHKIYDFNGIKSEWEDIASCKKITEDYNVLIKNIPNSPTINQDVTNRIVLGLTDIISEEKPDTIIIGGPIAQIFSRLKKPLKSALPKSSPKIIGAKRPDESVIYGCYLYAKQH